MLETPHVVVGAAIAFKVVNPALALPLALGSHFILEKVPHWNPHLFTEKTKLGKVTRQSTIIIIADATLAFLSGIFIAYKAIPNETHSITILIACFLSVLPDLVEGPYFFLNAKSKLIERWIHFQKSLQADADIIPGLLTQFLVVVAAFWWIIN